MKTISGKGYNNMNHVDINVETHWVSLFIDRNIAVYFDSFEIEYIFHKKYEAKSKMNQSLTRYLEYSLMILLCANCIVLLS